MIEWSEVVGEHGPLVWRVVTRLVRNPADAADCFQATFLSALEWSRRESVRSWPAVLTHLATSRSLEWLRKATRNRRRVSNAAFDSESLPDPAQASPPDDGLLAAELSDQLRGALATLEPREAEVFCLVCLEDLSYQQVGERLAINANHVGVILHRAKVALRRELTAYDPRPRGPAEVRP
jgi:RNA polymerase sigma-70 factor (ECF subfamily)